MLDLVISSHPATITDCTVGREFSDHCLLSFCICRQAISSSIPGRKILLYDKGDYNQIRKDIKRFSYTFFKSSPDLCTVNENWLKFKQALHLSVTRNVPSKLISSSRRKPVWFTAEVRHSIKLRNNLAKIAARSKSEIDRNRYRKARNLASKAISTAYVNHLNLVIGNLTEDPRGFYRFIKNKRTDSNGIPSLKTSSGVILTDEEKAKSLNDYFVSVFTKEDENTIPSKLGISA